MGSFAFLQIGKYEIHSSKNEFQNIHSFLFQVGDERRVEDSSTLEPNEREQLAKPLSLACDRLELMGYTLRRAQLEFEHPGMHERKPIPISFESALNLIRQTNVATIDTSFYQADSIPPNSGRLIPSELREAVLADQDRFMLTGHWDLEALMAHLDPYSRLRVLAESELNRVLDVIWDFHDIVRGGWVPRSSFVPGLDREEQFLIVTEGTSDSSILRHALKLLRPHIADFFRFVDMEEGYPFSGTGNVVNFVKGLISIGVQNRIVVVFDNDLEGVLAMRRCLALNVPENMKIVKLPDLQAHEAYSTDGTDGPGRGSINGKAAAIECYLDVPPERAIVRWTAFNEAEAKYHGALIGKDRFKRQFLDQREPAVSYDYGKINAVLDVIVAACVEMAEIRNPPYLVPTGVADDDDVV